MVSASAEFIRQHNIVSKHLSRLPFDKLRAGKAAPTD